MTLELYFHPLSSYCQKALVALYENDTPFQARKIDLSDATFTALGLRDNAAVEWRFVHRGYVPLPRLSLTEPRARGILQAR